MSLKIYELKNLVHNGWTIENRRNLEQVIGSDELKKLGKAFQKLEEDLYMDNAQVEGDVWIPTGEIKLSQINNDLALTLNSNITGFFVPNTTQKFLGKEINLETITKRIQEFQKNTINYFKNAKELPESALESKTMKKLFSPEFKTARRLNEDGYYVTTIIDKKTGKPVEAFIKRLTIDPDPTTSADEDWGIFIKNDTGKYELVGKRIFSKNKQLKKILPQWMDAEGGNDRFAGIGLREHQITVERMMQLGFDSIEICAEAQAFPFHYKSGFRVMPLENEISQEKINYAIDFWTKTTGISKDELKKAVVSRTDGDKTYIHSQTIENWRKMLFLKNNGKYCTGDTPMELRGEWLKRWKQMAKSQPILLDE